MRVNQKLTITAGTPINFLTFLSDNAGVAAKLAALAGQAKATRLYVQVISGTGDVYVMGGIFGNDGTANKYPRVPISTNVGDVTAILALNSTGRPVVFTDTAPAFENCGIPIETWWIDGSHTGDAVIISYDLQD